MEPEVYALMITGKDEKRIKFARDIGVPNFDEQTYKNKKMIIINENNTKVLTQPRADIYELQINRNNLSLGDMRNLSLEMVPLNAVFYIHDDDDYRPAHYLKYLVTELLKQKAFAVFIKNRLEYNLANGYMFKHRFENGTTHLLCRKLDKLRYLNKDTLEDTELVHDLSKFKKKYIILENDSRMYLRIIHGDNTSPFAVSSRNSIKAYDRNDPYKEFEVNEIERKYVKNIISKYYLI